MLIDGSADDDENQNTMKAIRHFCVVLDSTKNGRNKDCLEKKAKRRSAQVGIEKILQLSQVRKSTMLQVVTSPAPHPPHLLTPNRYFPRLSGQ